jgi:hypothetical protein
MVEGRSKVGSSFLGDVESRDKGGGNSHGAVMTGAERSPCGEHGHREQGHARDWATVPSGQNGNELLTVGRGPAKSIFKFSNSTQTYKFKK